MNYSSKADYTKTCPSCEDEFYPDARNADKQIYCTRECGRKAYLFTGGRPKLPKGTIGAVSELNAANDLMLQGFEVFRALSPHCSCDLVAMRDQKMLRIEVRTGQINRVTGTLTFPRNDSKKTSRLTEADLDHYAVVTWEEKTPSVIYIPPLPEGGSE